MAVYLNQYETSLDFFPTIPNFQAGEIARARFVTSAGQTINGQNLADKKLAAQIIGKAFKRGWHSEFAATKSAGKAVQIVNDGWDDLLD